MRISDLPGWVGKWLTSLRKTPNTSKTEENLQNEKSVENIWATERGKVWITWTVGTIYKAGAINILL